MNFDFSTTSVQTLDNDITFSGTLKNLLGNSVEGARIIAVPRLPKPDFSQAIEHVITTGVEFDIELPSGTWMIMSIVPEGLKEQDTIRDWVIIP